MFPIQYIICHILNDIKNLGEEIQVIITNYQSKEYEIEKKKKDAEER